MFINVLCAEDLTERGGAYMAYRQALLKTKLHFTSKVLSYLNTFHKWQRYSQQEMRALQEAQLKKLLSTAYRDVPYYRKLLAECGVVNANGEVRLEHFSRLPLLDRDTMYANYQALTSQRLKDYKWYKATTGGTTGNPAILLQNFIYFDQSVASKILFDEWTKYSMSDKKAILWGSERDLFVGRETFRVRFARWTRNELWLNAYDLAPERMRSYLEQLNAFKPVQLLAYVEALYSLACFAKANQLEVASPKAILTSAGTLFPHMRRTIEEVFQAPVYNRYGTREVGDIACECPKHEGMHTLPFTHYLEILRPDGSPAKPGELGEVVITLLTNDAMPLIRYRIGDMAAWAEKPCSCGMQLPLLKEVSGRVTDAFYRPDGGVVIPQYLVMLAGETLHSSGVRKFQIVQESLSHVLMLIDLYPGASYPQRELEEVSAKIRLLLGEGCKVEAKVVPAIAPSASGKYRFTISKVQPQSQHAFASLQQEANQTDLVV
jgi:phenylacetate-CoA ligase